MILSSLNMKLKKILPMLKWSFLKITVCRMKLRTWLKNYWSKIPIKGWAILVEPRRSCYILGLERSIGHLSNQNHLKFHFHPIWTSSILIRTKLAWAKKDSPPKSKKNIERWISEGSSIAKRKNDKAAKNICPQTNRPTLKNCLKVAKKTKKELFMNLWVTF